MVDSAMEAELKWGVPGSTAAIPHGSLWINSLLAMDGQYFIVIVMEIEFALRRRPGRPLSFDRDAALEQAMLLFWKHGYESTSISDLTGAMGITVPILYTAFGNKKRLFLEAIQRYSSASVLVEQRIAQAPNAREAAYAILLEAADRYPANDTPAGCLLASATISCSAEAADVQRRISAIRLRTEDLLADKIDVDVAEGQLPIATDAGALASHVMAVLQGMSTLARDGASHDKLTRLAHCAMAAWPPVRKNNRKVRQG